MEIILAVLAGIPMTLAVTGTSLLIGTLIAMPLVLALRSSLRPVATVARTIVDIVRGIPPIVWLFVVFYGVSIGSFRFGPFAAGVVTLGVVGSVYIAEIFRGALKSVPSGQWEAAAALGFSHYWTWGTVIGPQAWRTALPSYTTFAVALLKDSSIVSTIGVAEVMFRTGQEARGSSLGIFVYLVAAAVYIAISVPLTTLSRTLDVRLRKAVAR